MCTIISGEHYTKPATAGLHDSSKEILHLGARYKLRALGSNKIFQAEHTLIEPLTTLDHLEIPSNPDVIDPADVQRCLTADELHQLWNSASESISDNKRLFLHWHQRLGHPIKKTMYRLAMKGIIPKRLAKVTKIPLCAAYIFSKAQKRPWRTSNPKVGTIRDRKDTCL